MVVHNCFIIVHRAICKDFVAAGIEFSDIVEFALVSVGINFCFGEIT